MEHVDFTEWKAQVDLARKAASQAEPRSKPGAEAAASITTALESLSDLSEVIERQVKRNRLDFSSYLEMARTINSQGLNFSRIESYVRNLLRGRLFTTQVHLLREGTAHEKVISCQSDDPRIESVVIGTQSRLAEWLAKLQAPFPVASQAGHLSRFEIMDKLTAARVEVVVPLVHLSRRRRLEVKGVLLLGPKLNGQAYGESDFEFLGFLAEMLAIALNNAYLYYQSTRDALTKIYSRGHFDVVLNAEFSRTRRELEHGPDSTEPTVSLIMADLDHFKSINDTFGHQAGDNILQSVADALSTHLRDYDTLARYGGEEFVVLLPNTGKTKAAEVADRLRAEVEKLPVPFRKEPVTISLGVATFPGDAGNLRELIRQADNALYGSKRAGRNRVTLAGAPNPGPPPASSSAG